ncbi:hypothetical protein DUGA2_11940 [Duganella sp. HH101]|nr:hypothetical protein DUGA2_11940 [Duganella sp. HH101]
MQQTTFNWPTASVCAMTSQLATSPQQSAMSGLERSSSC